MVKCLQSMKKVFFAKVTFYFNYLSNFFLRYFFTFTQVTFLESTFTFTWVEKSRLTFSFTQVMICSTLNKSALKQINGNVTLYIAPLRKEFHCRSAQVWHALSTNLTNLPKHSPLPPPCTIPAFYLPNLAGRYHSTYIEGRQTSKLGSPASKDS